MSQTKLLLLQLTTCSLLCTLCLNGWPTASLQQIPSVLKEANVTDQSTKDRGRSIILKVLGSKIKQCRILRLVYKLRMGGKQCIPVCLKAECWNPGSISHTLNPFQMTTWIHWPSYVYQELFQPQFTSSSITWISSLISMGYSSLHCPNCSWLHLKFQWCL